MKVDVNYLAKKINLTVKPAEAKKLQNGFNQTLTTVSLLNQLDTPGISPNFQVTGLSNITRKDKIDLKRTFTQAEALKNTPSTYQGYFVVKAILHET
ncbi:MAG: Asp-tRNA(Asn)/Glu-tRNA(Gln) amidotransferase subunit GatC [Candidatus Beckwithbacteria bacterium]